MNEMIEQAVVAVAAVLDQSVWALESTEIVTRMASLEDIATSARVAQATLAHELAGRDWARTHGSTSTANFLRDYLRISGTAADRLLKLGPMLDRREAMGPAMARGHGRKRCPGRSACSSLRLSLKRRRRQRRADAPTAAESGDAGAATSDDAR